MSESQRELYSGVVTVHWDEQSTTHTRELIRVIIRDPLFLSFTQSKAKCLPSCGGKMCTQTQAQINHNGMAPFPTPHYAVHTYGTQVRYSLGFSILQFISITPSE